MEKEYTAVLKLGIETDTWDTEGKITNKKEVVDIKQEELYGIISSMQGVFTQQPPVYSAKKIKGRPSYYYARNRDYNDSNIALKKADVNIYSIELLSFDGTEAKIDVRCSAGTYVRSIIHEIGNRLKTGATLTGLVRKKIDGFSLDDCMDISDMKSINEENDFKRFSRSIIPVEELAIRNII